MQTTQRPSAPTTLVFPARRVRTLLRHSLAADRRMASFVQGHDPKFRHDRRAFDSEEAGRAPLPSEIRTDAVPPGLLLQTHEAAASRLVYLVSNGLPLQWAPEGGMTAAWARGYAPHDAADAFPPGLSGSDRARYVGALAWKDVLDEGASLLRLKIAGDERSECLSVTPA